MEFCKHHIQLMASAACYGVCCVLRSAFYIQSVNDNVSTIYRYWCTIYSQQSNSPIIL